jgi:hypothetical protein
MKKKLQRQARVIGKYTAAINNFSTIIKLDDFASQCTG